MQTMTSGRTYKALLVALLLLGWFSCRSTALGAVTNFTLVNADTGADISVLQDAASIDLTSTPTRNLSIRSNLDATPGSVLFTLNGKTYHVEDGIPFTLGGYSNGIYFAWTPEAGSYSLTATPYSGTNGTGAAGTGLSISFTVNDDYSHRLGGIIVNAAPGVAVAIEQTRHDFIFGCMLNIQGFDGSMSTGDEAMYKATFLSNFNYSVHGNVMKWYSTEPDWWKPGNSNEPPRWSHADLMLDWCESNSVPMRGHTLFWGATHVTTGATTGVAWTPDWVEALNDSDLAGEVRTRATNATARYAGRIDEFDFNNEMMHGNFFQSRLGWGGISNMAAWAKQGNPDCTLYANDFNVLNGNEATYVSHINTLLSQGVAIDGVGCQGHFSSALSESALKTKLDNLSSLGLPIKVTEYDCNTTSETTKRDALENLFRACFAHGNVDGIIQWGFWEGRHWRPDAALWNTDWSPTLAADKYRDLVFREWWTTAGGEVPSSGSYPFRAFLGSYTVTIDGVQHTVELTPEQSAISLTYDGVSVSTNYPVQVQAGDDIILGYPTLVANLAGTIVDSGAGSATSVWSQISGPGTVTFGDASSTNTTVTLPSLVGSYVLRFFAGDGTTYDFDDLTVTLSPPVTNMIANHGFETGTTAGWTDHASLTLSVVSGEAQEGTYSCRNSGRNATYDGVARELNGIVGNGKTYVISAWVKLESIASDSVQLTVKKIEDGGSAYKGVASITATNSEWRRLAGEYTVSTTGTVTSLLLYMSGPAIGESYWADNFACYEGTLATLDVDMDSIVDEWEWQHFGSTSVTAGGESEDQDGDGFIDINEYYALTDPNDSNDVFVVEGVSIVASNANHTISWYGAAGRLYSVLSTTDMTGSWATNAYQLPGQGATMSYTNASSPGTAFYRLRVELDI